MTYILLKDLPGVKAGAESENKADCYVFKHGETALYAFSENEIKNNPEWFKLKEEPYVSDIHYEHGYYVYRLGHEDFYHQISKQRLAKILIE